MTRPACRRCSGSGQADDQLAGLARLRDEGKIAAIGLSNVSAEQVESAADADIAAVDAILAARRKPSRRHTRAHGARGGGGRRRARHRPVAARPGLASSPLRANGAHPLARAAFDRLAENAAVAGIALPPEVLSRLDGLPVS